jgi:hypothetical protein
MTDDPWKTYRDAARAAGETFARVPDYGGSGSLYQQVPVTEASDCGHVEPSPCDLGIANDPEAPWLLFNGQPVMEGDGGRLVYDCQPESGDGCIIPVPEPEA